MGRFYRTAKLPLMDVTYQEPLDLLMKGVQVDTSYRDKAVQASDAYQQQLASINHLNLDAENELLEQETKNYQGRINDLANMAYSSTDYGQMNKGIRGLQHDIMNNLQTGQLSQIINRYATVENWKKNNAELLKKDPDTYNRLYGYQMNMMDQGIQSNPNYQMNWENGIATPDFQKKFLEVAKTMLPDVNFQISNGYIVTDKNLSQDRLMSVWRAIWDDPTTRRWAVQQTKLGTPGLMEQDQNGNMRFVSPTAMAYNGSIINGEQYNMLSPEEKQKVRSILNPNWALSSVAGNFANAESYSQKGVKSDATWVARLNESGRNARAVADNAIKLQRLAFDKQKHADDMAQKAAELRAKGSSGKGGSGSNAMISGPTIQNVPNSISGTYAESANSKNTTLQTMNEEAGRAGFDAWIAGNERAQYMLSTIIEARHIHVDQLEREAVQSGNVTEYLKKQLELPEVAAKIKANREFYKPNLGFASHDEKAMEYHADKGKRWAIGTLADKVNPGLFESKQPLHDYTHKRDGRGRIVEAKDLGRNEQKEYARANSRMAESVFGSDLKNILGDLEKKTNEAFNTRMSNRSTRTDSALIYPNDSTQALQFANEAYEDNGQLYDIMATKDPSNQQSQSVLITDNEMKKALLRGFKDSDNGNLRLLSNGSTAGMLLQYTDPESGEDVQLRLVPKNGMGQIARTAEFVAQNTGDGTMLRYVKDQMDLPDAYMIISGQQDQDDHGNAMLTYDQKDRLAYYHKNILDQYGLEPDDIDRISRVDFKQTDPNTITARVYGFANKDLNNPIVLAEQDIPADQFKQMDQTSIEKYMLQSAIGEPTEQIQR